MFALRTRAGDRLEMLTDVVELFGQFRAVREIVALFETECAMSFGSNIEETNGRRENDAVDWCSIVNQGDINGELPILFNKFLSSIEGVH